MDEPIGEAGESFLRGHSGRIAIALALGSAGTSVGRQLIPLLLPTIIDELAITATAAGVAVTVMWATFALVQYPGGRYSDRLTRVSVVVFGLGTMVLGFALLTAGITYVVLVVAVGLVGIGTGLFIVSMRVMLSDLFVERRGQAFGLNTSANMLGGAIAAGISVVAVTWTDWELAFVPVVAVLVVVLVLLHAWRRDPYEVRRVELGAGTTVHRVLGSRRVQLLVVAYSLHMVTWQGVFNFLPTMLRTSKGFSPTLAAVGFAIPFFVGIVAMPVAGGLSDGMPRLPITAGGLLLSGFGLLLIVTMPLTLPVMFGIVCFAAGIMTFPPVMQAYLMDSFPDSSLGGDFGAFRTIYFAVGSLGPTYVGVASDHFSYPAAFASLMACLLTSSVIITFIFRVER